MNKGDIILIPFSFTNLKGTKRRPAVILYAGNLDVIVAFITSNLNWKEETDLEIFPEISNGLKKPSLVRTDKIATLEAGMVIGKIGAIRDTQLRELDKKLKLLFKI